jgi:hypothetical protein
MVIHDQMLLMIDENLLFISFHHLQRKFKDIVFQLLSDSGFCFVRVRYKMIR